MCLEGQHMQILTKFLWLQSPVALGDQIDGWQVCWLGGWDRCKVFFVVMVVKRVRFRPAFNARIEER
jgi:hypothetical protein